MRQKRPWSIVGLVVVSTSVVVMCADSATGHGRLGQEERGHYRQAAGDAHPAQIEIEVLTIEFDIAFHDEVLRAFHIDPRSTKSGPGSFAISFTSDKCTEIVGDLQAKYQLYLVAGPSLLTADNQAAHAIIGQCPYVATRVVAGRSIPVVLPDDIRTQVQVTPKVKPDGSVVADVVPEVWLESSFEISDGVVLRARSNTHTLNATATTKADETAVIGVLACTRVKMGQQSIPILGDLPWVGKAFQFRTFRRQKVELLVFVTPRVKHGTMPH